MKAKRLAADAVFVVISLCLSMITDPASVDSLIAVSTGLAAFAGVVVTVFGIWLAVIFPRLMSGLESGVKSEDNPDRDRFNELVKSLYRSCFVLCASFFVLLLISLSGARAGLISLPFSFFAWLCFFSVSSALWSSVANGEVSAVAGINVGILKGVKSRIRGRGRTEVKKRG